MISQVYNLLKISPELFIVITLVIGMLVNFSKGLKYHEDDDEKGNTSPNSILHRINYKSSLASKNGRTEEEKGQKKKRVRRNSLDKRNSDRHHRASSRDASRPSKRKTEKTSSRSLAWKRIFKVFILPQIVLCLIPSIYPIYKHILTPHLPQSVQQVFTDLRVFLLKVFNYVVSLALMIPGRSTDYRHTTFESLEDWVHSCLGTYSLDLNTNLTDLFLFCSTCTSPASPLQQLYFAENAMCLECDFCLRDGSLADSSNQPTHHISNSELLNDVMQIVEVGKRNTQTSAVSDVLKECLATFSLYIKFTSHLIFLLIRNTVCVLCQAAKYIFMVYNWMIVEIINNLSLNPTRAMIIGAILLLTSVLLVSIMRIIGYIISSGIAWLLDTRPATSRGSRKSGGGSGKNGKHRASLSNNSAISLSPSSSAASPTSAMLSTSMDGKGGNQPRNTDSYSPYFTNRNSLHEEGPQPENEDDEKEVSRGYNGGSASPFHPSLKAADVTSSELSSIPEAVLLRMKSLLQTEEWRVMEGEQAELARLVMMMRMDGNDDLQAEEALLRVFESLQAEKEISLPFLTAVRKVLSSIQPVQRRMQSIKSHGNRVSIPFSTTYGNEISSPIPFANSSNSFMGEGSTPTGGKGGNPLLSPVFARNPRTAFFRQTSIPIRKSRNSDLSWGNQGGEKSDSFEDMNSLSL